MFPSPLPSYIPLFQGRPLYKTQNLEHVGPQQPKGLGVFKHIIKNSFHNGLISYVGVLGGMTDWIFPKHNDHLPKIMDEKMHQASLGHLYNSDPQSEKVTLPKNGSSVLSADMKNIDTIDIHTVTAGDPSNPPVILLHGFPHNWYTWRFLIPKLVEQGNFVIAPDLRGTHLSDKPTSVDDYKLSSLADDVQNLLRYYTKLEHPLARTIVGHDTGASVMYKYAETYPKSVEKLVAINGVHAQALVDNLFQDNCLDQILRYTSRLLFDLPFNIGARKYSLLPRAATRYEMGHECEFGERNYWTYELARNLERHHSSFSPIIETPDIHNKIPIPMDWDLDSSMSPTGNTEVAQDTTHKFEYQRRAIRRDHLQLARVWGRFATNFQAVSHVYPDGNVYSGISLQANILRSLFKNDSKRTWPFLTMAAHLSNPLNWSRWLSGKPDAPLDFDKTARHLESVPTKQIEIPTLILWGAESDLYSRDTINKSNQRLTNAIFAPMTNGDHLVHLERPEHVGKKIASFIKDPQAKQIVQHFSPATLSLTDSVSEIDVEKSTEITPETLTNAFSIDGYQ